MAVRFRLSTIGMLGVQWTVYQVVDRILHHDLPKLREQSREPRNGFKHLFLVVNEGCVARRVVTAALLHPNMRRVLQPFEEHIDIELVTVPRELLERGEDASAVVVRVCLEWPQGREAVAYELGPDVDHLGNYGGGRVFVE